MRNGSQPQRPQLSAGGRARPNRVTRSIQSVADYLRHHQPEQPRRGRNSTSRPSRARRARPPRSSSPNTTCRAKKRCRMTWSSMPTATPGTPISARSIVGELDPKTGKVTDYALPALRKDQPKGTLDLELDPNGNLWVCDDVSGRRRQDRPQDQGGQRLSLSRRMGGDQHAQTSMVSPNALPRRRQGLDEQPVDPRAIPARSRDRQMGEPGRRVRTRAASRSAATACRSTRTTTSSCWSSAAPASAGATPRTISSPSGRRRSRARGRGAAASTSTTSCGSPNSPATPSACSNRRQRKIKE